MILYFMRHGEAEDAGSGGDAARALTERGVQRTTEAAAALGRLDLALGLVLTSPLRRAVQTAELVAGALKVPVRQEKALGGNFSLDALARLAQAHDLPASVMLVGHEPDFSWVVGELIGGARLEMKKGAVACLEVRGFARGSGYLRWLLTGRQLSLMARDDAR